MKLNNKISLTIIAAMLIAGTGCKKLLEEKPRALITPDFFATPEGIEGGIAGAYGNLRNLWGTQIFTQLWNGGTDEMITGGSADVRHNFTYAPTMSANTNDYGGLWNIMYQNINSLNGVLEYGAVAQMDATKKAQLLAQAKFLRAFSYFYLVQSFGDVPLHLTFITTPTLSDSRQPIADVYNAIIKDLTEAIVDLPNTPGATLGKPAYKATALYLLAKTYLTRGWSSAAVATDFQNAYTTAAGIITNKATYGLDLWPNFADANREGNEYGRETLLVIDHTKDLKYGQNSNVGSGAGGAQENKSNFMFRPNYPTITANYPAGGGAVLAVRDIQNGRPFLRIRPNTVYAMNVAFADRVNDSRYNGTFQTHWLASSTINAVPGSTGATTARGTLINKVDTAIWMPERFVTPAERAAFKGVIMEPDVPAGAVVPITANVYPSMKKYDDSTRGHENDYSDRPLIMFRFAEVYLIAAEAAFKGGGTMQNAADMLNVLRQRAAFRPSRPGLTSVQNDAANAAAVIAQTITAGQVTLNFILEERTREMYGEFNRWYDLVRTKTLVSRVQQYNTEAAPNIKPEHMLRPIPQQQIDLVTEGPKFPQNPGY